MICRKWVRLFTGLILKECVYNIDHVDHIYPLQIENTSESDPHSYKATKAVTKKALRLPQDLNQIGLNYSICKEFAITVLNFDCYQNSFIGGSSVWVISQFAPSHVWALVRKDQLCACIVSCLYCFLDLPVFLQDIYFVLLNIPGLCSVHIPVGILTPIAVITVEPAVQRSPCESAWNWGVWVMINRENSELKQIVRGTYIQTHIFPKEGMFKCCLPSSYNKSDA